MREDVLPEREEQPTEPNPRSRNTRKHKIRCCGTGVEWITASITPVDAQRVAEWCDEHHPDCGPHKVISREKRTWKGRQQ